MANTNLFKTKRGVPKAPPADAINEAGGTAYALPARQALAQFIATGTFNGTYYSKPDAQLAAVTPLLDKIALEEDGHLFIAKCAFYGRHTSHMKDVPAFLVAYLGCKGSQMFGVAFETVIDNGKMLRNFVQMVRSGTLGRRSFGSTMKRSIKAWIDARDSRALLNASVGNQPSLADIIRMVHPRPKPLHFPYPPPTRGMRIENSAIREGLYGYLLGHAPENATMPTIIHELEGFREAVKLGGSCTLPDVNFDLLTSMPLTPKHWTQIAQRAGHQWLRMNLKTMARHEVLNSVKVADAIAAKLRDPVEIRRARQFPYQYLTAFNAIVDDMAIPPQIKGALQDAMDVSCENIPEFPRGTVVCVDTSGSMDSPITGDRGSATTAMSCKSVAAMFAAAILKKNPDCAILPFGTDCNGPMMLNPRDALATLSNKICAHAGGGTKISAPLEFMNLNAWQPSLVVYLSDNESWIETYDSTATLGPLFKMSKARRVTATMDQWERLTQRRPHAKLVMIDLQPGATSQAPDRSDVLNIGGWSDRIFQTIATFVRGGQQSWVNVIDEVNFRVDRVSDHA